MRCSCHCVTWCKEQCQSNNIGWQYAPSEALDGSWIQLPIERKFFPVFEIHRSILVQASTAGLGDCFSSTSAWVITSSTSYSQLELSWVTEPSSILSDESGLCSRWNTRGWRIPTEAMESAEWSITSESLRIILAFCKYTHVKAQEIWHGWLTKVDKYVQHVDSKN